MSSFLLILLLNFLLHVCHWVYAVWNLCPLSIRISKSYLGLDYRSNDGWTHRNRYRSSHSCRRAFHHLNFFLWWTSKHLNFFRFLINDLGSGEKRLRIFLGDINVHLVPFLLFPAGAAVKEWGFLFGCCHSYKLLKLFLFYPTLRIKYNLLISLSLETQYFYVIVSSQPTTKL